LHRAQPGSVKLEDKAHDYKYMSLVEMGRHLLIAAGQPGNSFSPSEVVKRAIATTDYANLLNSTVERAIRRTYDAVTPEWKSIARQTTAKDFREKTGIAVDGKVTFEEVAEGGEYKHSLLMTDDSAKLKLKTYGRKISITRQAIINDDLDVFSKLPEIIAYGAADFQAAKVWGLLTGNAKTPDGKALFHVDHKNLAASPNTGPVSEALLALARTAMFRQKTPAGNLMSVAPKYLVVPMEQMVTAQKIMQSLISSAQMDVNTMKGQFEIITSPYLTSAVEWYLAGDVARAEGLVYAYLEGEEGLFIDKETSFDDDSITTKARLDFDCAVWGYNSWYKNPGA
jgi:Mu-like prophage major head subunit gpT